MKSFSKIISLALVVVFALFCFAGCGFVRDMDEVNAIRDQKAALQEARDQMNEIVAVINGEIDVEGSYYGWFFANEANYQYSQLMSEMESGSAATSAGQAPEIDLDLVKENIKIQVCINKLGYLKAIENGVEILPEDVNAIEAQINQYKSEASAQGLSFDDYLLLFNTNEAGLRKILEDQYYAYRYVLELPEDEQQSFGQDAVLEETEKANYYTESIG